MTVVSLRTRLRLTLCVVLVSIALTTRGRAWQSSTPATPSQKLALGGPCSGTDECPSGCTLSELTEHVELDAHRLGLLPHLQIDQFDPALGDLKGVKVQVKAQALDWKYQFSSLSDAPCTPGQAQSPDCPVRINPLLGIQLQPVQVAHLFDLGVRKTHWPIPLSQNGPLFCEPGLAQFTAFSGNAGLCGEDLLNAPCPDAVYGSPPTCSFNGVDGTISIDPLTPPCGGSASITSCSDFDSGKGYAYVHEGRLLAWRVCWPAGDVFSFEPPCFVEGQTSLTGFEGTGTWTITTQEAEGGGQILDNGLSIPPNPCANYSHARVVKIRAEATVTYYYCPNNQPPTAYPDAATVCHALDVATPPNADCPTYVDIPVLANDCDEDDGQPECFGDIVCSSLTITQPPMHGTYMVLGCNGTSESDCPPSAGQCAGCVVRYFPDAGYVGADTFCYTVQDGRQLTSNPAAVSIRVCPPPLAADDAFSTCVGEAITFNVFANDQGAFAVNPVPNTTDCGPGSFPPLDFPGCAATAIDCASLEILTQPASGTLTQGVACSGLPTAGGCGNCPGSNCLRYEPNAGFCGEDSFWYRIRDTAGCCEIAKVTIRVFAPPVACADDAVTCEKDACLVDECILIPILANDRTCPSTGGCAGTPCAGCPGPASPLDCASVVITQAPPPSCGTIEINQACAGEPNGGCNGACVRFCPAPGFRGTCTFKYRVSDQRTLPAGACQTNPFPCQSNEATVTIVVRCKPNATDDQACDESPETLDVIVIDVLGGDSPGADIPECTGATYADPPITLDLTGTDPAACTCPGGPTKGTAAVILDNGVYKIQYTQTQPLLPGEVDRFCYKLTTVYPDGTTCCDVACVTVSLCACEERNRLECGSLLLYAEYDTTPGNRTLFTITDACCEEPTGNTAVEFVFIDSSNCLEFNRTFTLTPCDTLTFLVDAAAVPPSRGYAYAFAKSTAGGPNNPNGVPIVHNRLIGQLLRLSALDEFQYSVNAVSFKGWGPEGATNDDDQDGVRDLNGTLFPYDAPPYTDKALWEYDGAPEQILIPRFLGQDDPAAFDSQIVLIGLSGGSQFDTTIDISVFNDNEQMTSAQHTFFCWSKVSLKDFTGGTLQSQLSIGDDDDEIVGWPPPKREAGWLLLNGLVASSNAEDIQDPAIYAVLIERVGNRHAAGLPFEICSQKNGDLLPDTIFGDGPNRVAGDNQ